MYYCAKACDKSCSQCCDCMDSCCGDCCDALQKCFSQPFSLCTFLTFFAMLAPFALGVVALVQASSYDCNEPLKLLIIIQSIGNLLNFIFCLYLMCQYRKGNSKEQ